MLNERKISDLYNRLRTLQINAAGDVAVHAALTTTAHGLGASAFHADSYFALAGHTHAQLHDAVTLATDSGLSLSTQQIAMGTPGSLNASTTNAVSTSTHTHAVSGFDLAGTTAAHASLTTTAHGLGESAFHADSYFALAGHTHDQLHDSATLATNSGLSLSGQIFSMGTPSTCTAGTSNAVTSATHTHQITGFDPAGTTATHAALTTTAHGLGESAFHADSYFALASHTQNANTIIIPGGVGSPNYDDMQDFLNNTRSAGRIKGGVLTDHSPANGTVDISELEGMIFTTNALGGDLVYFKKAATSAVAITADNAVSWIYYDYTTGSYLSTTDRSTIHEYDQFPVGRVWRGGVYVETLTTGHNIYDKDRRAHNRLIAKYGAMDRSSGAIVFAHATPLRISVTDGSWYTGNTAYSTAATSVFEVWYKSGSATWVESTSLTLFSEVYDGGASKVFETYQNGNNIGTLSANRYGVYWLFVCPEGNLYVVLGTDSYSTIGAAQAASVPSDLPPYCVNWAVMVGKVICQKTAAALYSVESVYSISFTQSTATDHASLSNLNTTSYTHLTAANHTDLTDGGDTTLHTHSTMYSPLNHGVTVGTMPIATSTTAYGDSLFTQDATNILIDPTQTHRIGIGTAIPQHGMLQVNHTQANNQVIPIRTEGLYNCTADSSYDGYAFVGQSEIIISSGKTHSGIINGGYFKSLRKDADDYGHMTNLYGVSSVVGHFTGCQASILTDNASGYISQLFCQVGGITNAYSYIGGAITGTGTVVNFYQFYAGNRGTGYTLTGKAWDFYAVNTGSFNYFAGKTGIGITQPVGRLHVYGGASGLTPTIFTDFIVESNSQVGLNLIAPNASTACYAMGCPGNELMFMLDCNYNSGTETARMFVGGTRIMTMWDSGNMSIGNTTDSGYRVDVSSSIAVRNGATINSIGYDSLGTVSNNELYFKTYNVNKAVLSPAGKFGVGILTGLVGMVDINAGTAGDNLHLKTTDSAGTGIYFRNGFPSTPGLAEINCNYDLDSHSSMIINAAGYHGGTTKKRSLYIGDGAGGTIAYFQASNKYVMIGPLGSYPSYQLDVGNLETTTGYLSSFSQSELATGNSTRIKIGKIATTGNSAYLSYTWLSDNNVSNRFDFGFYGKETTPNLCAYNDGRIVIGSFAPWGSTYGLTVHASSGGDVFVETNAGSGIQLFGTLSGGITNNYLQAVAIGGGTPAFFNLSIGSNIAIKLNESGDTQCNYKFACNGNSPVGKSATATTLAQVITCLQDFGFMS